jgi:HEAT repeat protein
MNQLINNHEQVQLASEAGPHQRQTPPGAELPPSIRLLLEILKHPCAVLRQEAVRQLGRLAPKTPVVEAVLSRCALGDDAVQVRQAAERALAAIRQRAATRPQGRLRRFHEALRQVLATPGW